MNNEIIALKAMLKMVEFSAAGEQCCPVCGGNQHHDTACQLAALVYPAFAESYNRETGGDTAVKAMLWLVSNDDKYKFLANQEAA